MFAKPIPLIGIKMVKINILSYAYHSIYMEVPPTPWGIVVMQGTPSGHLTKKEAFCSYSMYWQTVPTHLLLI